MLLRVLDTIEAGSRGGAESMDPALFLDQQGLVRECSVDSEESQGIRRAGVKMRSDSGGVRWIANVSEVLGNAGVEHIASFADVKGTAVVTKNKIDTES